MLLYRTISHASPLDASDEGRMSSRRNITSVLKETRAVPAAGRRSRGTAFINAAERDRLAAWAEKDPDALLGRAGQVAALVQAVDQGARLVERAARQVVRRRHN